MKVKDAPENSEYCLLLDVIKYRKSRIRGSEVEVPDEHDYKLASGPEKIRKYLSCIFGRVDDLPSFIESLDEHQMRKIFSESNISNRGHEVQVSLYLCDLGEGGGVTKVYSQSRKFRLSL